MATLGWDIGGVNTKAARVESGRVVDVRSRPYELQRDPAALTDLLCELAAGVGGSEPAAVHLHAVTMTAELSQLFRSKREGVAFVLDAVETAFEGHRVRVFAVDGRFLSANAARQEPLSVAGANWAATARVVAGHHPDALLIDVGTTTADVVPIVGGAVVAEGRTDPDRLASSELVYTGALRTPVEAIVTWVPLQARSAVGAGGKAEPGARTLRANVSAEGFALAGDVHVWRGDLDPVDYTVAAPDGRPPTRQFAGERLARVVCADREMLDEAAVSAIAAAVADAQVEQIATAVRAVRGRHPSIAAAVATGVGAFIAERAARRAGLSVVPLSLALGAAAARCAPAACVALLVERAEPAPSAAGSGASDAPRRTGKLVTGYGFASLGPSVGFAPLRGARSLDRGNLTHSSPIQPVKTARGRDRRTADRRLADRRGADRRPAHGDAAAVATRQAPVGANGTTPGPARPIVDLVVKIGGGVLQQPQHFAAALQLVAETAAARRLLIVPGGGPFADAVRAVDERLALSPDAAHWMAILAMDQYAELLASKLPGSRVVTSGEAVAQALATNCLPILAPSRWLRERDPLPHSWDATSDSIAAWVAGQLAAPRLVLIKPAGADPATAVDAHFFAALPSSVQSTVVAASDADGLRRALMDRMGRL